jgi:hypothetical protein
LHPHQLLFAAPSVFRTIEMSYWNSMRIPLEN